MVKLNKIAYSFTAAAATSAQAFSSVAFPLNPPLNFPNRTPSLAFTSSKRIIFSISVQFCSGADFEMQLSALIVHRHLDETADDF